MENMTLIFHLSLHTSILLLSFESMILSVRDSKMMMLRLLHRMLQLQGYNISLRQRDILALHVLRFVFIHLDEHAKKAEYDAF